MFLYLSQSPTLTSESNVLSLMASAAPMTRFISTVKHCLTISHLGVSFTGYFHGPRLCSPFRSKSLLICHRIYHAIFSLSTLGFLVPLLLSLMASAAPMTRFISTVKHCLTISHLGVSISSVEPPSIKWQHSPPMFLYLSQSPTLTSESNVMIMEKEIMVPYLVKNKKARVLLHKPKSEDALQVTVSNLDFGVKCHLAHNTIGAVTCRSPDRVTMICYLQSIL
jgi:hypothetical protein